MSASSNSLPIRIVLVEDDAVTRRALSMAIESEPVLKLVGSFETVKDALGAIDSLRPDALLTDLGLPDGSGIEIITYCAKNYPHCDIMVITVSADQENVLASIEAGASGYILKDMGKLDITRAILDLKTGGAPMSPGIARLVLHRLRDGKRPPQAESARTAEGDPLALTPRETKILDLIARGGTYIEVAKELKVSVGTVQTHIKSIYGKLSVHSRSEAVFEAHRRGLLQLGEKGGE